MSEKMPSYLRQYVSDKDVGAVHASSRFLVRRLIRCLDFDRIGTMVELGPGPGVATRPILARLHEGAKYIAIEKNPAFVAALKNITDPRFRAIEGDARAARDILSALGVRAVDAVIASLPFSFLTKDERTGLVGGVYDLLNAGGTFVIFHQFSLLMRPFLKACFPDVHVEFELRNILPCFLLQGCK